MTSLKSIKVDENALGINHLRVDITKLKVSQHKSNMLEAHKNQKVDLEKVSNISADKLFTEKSKETKKTPETRTSNAATNNDNIYDMQTLECGVHFQMKVSDGETVYPYNFSYKNI